MIEKIDKPNISGLVNLFVYKSMKKACLLSCRGDVITKVHKGALLLQE